MASYSNDNPFGSSARLADDNHHHNDMISFFNEVDDIKRSLAHYDENVGRIESLHKRSLAEISEDSENFTNNQIQSLTQESKAMANDLKRRIKSLESRSFRDLTKKVQAENVKESFKSSIRKYQAIESNFSRKYKERAERQYRIVKPDATDAEVKEAIEDNNGSQIFSQALINSNRVGQANAALNEVQNRHKEIQQIAQTMNELAELFHDMELMVAEQEETVQYVERGMDQAQDNIEQGVGHQTHAVQSARAARKKKWWCLGIIIVILIIIAIILAVVLKK